MSERATISTAKSYIKLTVTNGVKVEKGNAAFFDLATDKLVASPAASTIAIGTYFETVTGDGTLKASVELPAEIRAQRFANDTGTAVAATDLFTACYFKDGGTVSKATTAGYPYAGIVLDVSTADGVLVAMETIPGLNAGLAQSISGLSYTTNDLAPAAVNPGAFYDVPTTGAASTITLPAAAQEGTIVYFMADGTKNGHTVTYRDATGPTALTTALTASKRHLTVCTFRGGKWFANAYVSP